MILFRGYIQIWSTLGIFKIGQWYVLRGAFSPLSMVHPNHRFSEWRVYGVIRGWTIRRLVPAYHGHFRVSRTR